MDIKNVPSLQQYQKSTDLALLYFKNDKNEFFPSILMVLNLPIGILCNTISNEDVIHH